MCPSSGDPPAVVEPQPDGEPTTLTVKALRQRIRQQEILAELGVAALQGATLAQLLDETTRLTAEGLRAEFGKVLEYIPAENRLLVRAGVGWDPGVVGEASVGADLASPAGFALRTGKPVISNHLENEERFRTPELLLRHGIHRAMNVILKGDGRPFGVLEVDSRSEDSFVEQDLAFLQGAANILGMAIERDRHERSLRAALQRHQFLLKEMNHRVKNSLAIISGMLRLQASDIEDPVLSGHLDEAARRVGAVGMAHDQLHTAGEVERLDIGRYLKAICRDLDAMVPHCPVRAVVEEGIVIATDRAISIALTVNELITNAAKYAYDEQRGGIIEVTLKRQGTDRLVITVADAGRGLPPGFDARRPKRLGMRIVAAFVEQLQGTLEVRALDPGAAFVVTLPLAYEA
jgi:two-component sensor histidine kinase